MFKTCLAGVLIGACCAMAHATITFTPGHFYSANYFSRDIIEYDASGNVLGSISIPSADADEIRGLAFGPDGLLYATAVRGSGFAVLALNSAGAITQTYPMGVYVFGNLSFGKLAVDGQHIYVAGQDYLTRFNIGNPLSGTFIYSNNQVFDVKSLPGGHLLVASAYEVNEITSDGTFVRSIEPTSASYGDVRGVEFDPVTNKMFVTHLGYTGFFHRLMRIDFTTGALEDNTTFTYADDLFLTDTGNLLVGSRSEVPRIYTQGLVPVGTLGTTSRMFVTEYVPEPGMTCSLLVFGYAILFRRRWPAGRRRPDASFCTKP